MSIPLIRLPSLDLVRGFVAVGRRMSITLAAQDLCVTQSAVSRQVRALEDTLGVRLLVRGHRSIAFTPEGARLFRCADEAVAQLQDVVAQVTGADGRMPVTITASIGLTALWLLPRLGRFQQQWPDIDVRVAADNRLLDLRTEGIDLAIRYCAPQDAPPGAERLFGESVVPVAHPSLKLRRFDTPEAISRQVLLELDMPDRPWLHWGNWLAARGLQQARPRGTLHFNQYDQVIQAAIAGQGIAIGRCELIQPMLADGRLAAIGAPDHEASRHGYWLIGAQDAPREATRKVAAWIRAEARAGEAAARVPAFRAEERPHTGGTSR